MSVNLKQHESAAESSKRTLNGAQILVESLKRENVEVIFGYPGGAVLPIYDALYDGGIPHVLTRHEQGAIHAAEGYARVTGRPGVVMATSGPGATNLVTGLADAMMDSLPLVVFTGQVATGVIGSDAFQEASIVGITMPITKHNYQVRDVDQLAQVIKEAFHIASTGRPGPVLIDVPKDVANALGLFDYDQPIRVPGYQPTIVPNRLQIRKVAKAIERAQKPVILAGAGLLHARAGEVFQQFVEKVNIPVANTLLGIGALPASHPLALGMTGMHGCYAANKAIYDSDLLINIGARFDDRVTGNLAEFAPSAVVVHVDIDPAEIGKNVATDIPVVGDAKEALKMLLEEPIGETDFAPWVNEVRSNLKEYPYWYKEDGVTLKPQRLIEMVHEITRGDAVVVTDVGQRQMWAAQFYPSDQPNRWETSGGLGTMGFGLPAAIGAQMGMPDTPVIAVLGDAGFQMTLQELSVFVEYQLPVKIVIVNNFCLGMVRQWQEIFYNKRYSESLMPVQPDFVKLAEAYRMPAYQATNEQEAKKALEEAMKTNGPVLIDCRVAPDENVFPMIPAGKGIHEMVGIKP